MIRFGADLEFEEAPLKRGFWSPEEDQILIAYINEHGIGNWNEMPKAAGLLRTGKSCRLRWMNYLRPGIKHGNFSEEEQKTILNLHEKLGNSWSAIAAELPGRTDNDIKNYWNARLGKRMRREAVQSAKAQGTQASNSLKKLLSEKETPLPNILESSGSGSLKELPMAPLEPSPVILSPMSINPSGEMNRDYPTMEEKKMEDIEVRIPFEYQLFMEDQANWFEEFFYPYTSQDDTSDYYWSNVFNQTDANCI